MKKWTILLVTLLFVGMIFWSCSGDDNPTEPANVAPTCEITSPADSSEYFLGDTILVQINATDEDGEIVEVRFYLDDIEIGLDTDAPFLQNIYTDTLALGYHLIKVEAEDDEDLETNKQINIKINEIPNNAPTIDSLIADPISVIINSSSTINCYTNDIEGDALSYLWDTTGGSITGSGSTTTWIAPDSIGIYSIKCVVSDGEETVSDSILISTIEIPNTPPVINSLTADPEIIGFSDNSILTCIANDIDEDVLTYTWQRSGGILLGDGSSVTWYPQDLGEYKIICSVSDGENTVFDSLLIVVTDPIIDSLTATPSILEISESTLLVCSARDIDNDSLLYTWEKTGGTIDGTGSTVNWVAPIELGTYTITCTVADGSGFDTRNVEITVINSSPVILDLMADSLIIVQNNSTTLTCTADDINGDFLTYIWDATGGEINGTGNIVEWIAPIDIGTYIITCTVSDSKLEAKDSLFITVIDTIPPSVTLLNPANLSIFNEGDLVTIQGEATDNASVSKVEFYIGFVVVSVDNTSPYECIWDTTGELGAHRIQLKAYDAGGNIGESEEIAVRVD